MKNCVMVRNGLLTANNPPPEQASIVIDSCFRYNQEASWFLTKPRNLILNHPRLLYSTEENCCLHTKTRKKKSIN
jgi:hypothetical protein